MAFETAVCQRLKRSSIQRRLGRFAPGERLPRARLILKSIPQAYFTGASGAILPVFSAPLHGLPAPPRDTLKTLLALLLIGLPAAAGCTAPPVTTPVRSAPSGAYRLVWEDPFDTDGRPDARRWTFDVGGGGWGNDELQTYTTYSQNARVEDGHLVIEAHENEAGAITSARLTTRGTFAFTHGRVEVVARPACFVGSWSAAWLLPDGFVYEHAARRTRPPAGEMDVLEHLGREPGRIFSAVHAYGRTARADSATVDDACDRFRTYRLDWSNDTLATFVDGRPVLRLTRLEAARRGVRWPFGYPYVLVLNVAVGGRWAARDGIDRRALRYGESTRMLVDAVRVYARTGTPLTSPADGSGW